MPNSLLVPNHFPGSFSVWIPVGPEAKLAFNEQNERAQLVFLPRSVLLPRVGSILAQSERVTQNSNKNKTYFEIMK